MTDTEESRNFLEEALAILNRTTRMEPERQHLVALNESRVMWRKSYWQITKALPTAPESRKAVRA